MCHKSSWYQESWFYLSASYAFYWAALHGVGYCDRGHICHSAYQKSNTHWEPQRVSILTLWQRCDIPLTQQQHTGSSCEAELAPFGPSREQKEVWRRISVNWRLVLRGCRTINIHTYTDTFAIMHTQTHTHRTFFPMKTFGLCCSDCSLAHAMHNIRPLSMSNTVLWHPDHLGWGLKWGPGRGGLSLLPRKHNQAISNQYKDLFYSLN